ncbi:MAG: hypothetical protein ACKODX_12010 [Gemmata sp.]
MKYRSVAITAVALIALAAAVAAAPKAEANKGLFAPLEVGLKVGLKEGAGGYTVSVVSGAQLSQKVVEVSADYVVLEDPTGTTQTRIPATAVRAVVVTRLPKEK